MKRYFIIAFAALLSLTACTIEEGYRPYSEQAYHLIHSQFNQSLNDAKTYANYAIVAQTLLEGSATDFACKCLAFFSDPVIMKEKPKGELI